MDSLSFLTGEAPKGLLSAIIFLPLIGAILLYLIPFLSPRHDTEGHRVRGFSLVVTILTFLLSLVPLLRSFSLDHPSALQLVERVEWIPSFGISYYLGIDGISLLLVVLTTFLLPLVVLASYSVDTKVRGYLANMLVLETAILGTLLSMDLFLFYVFWELMLAPMYFIIGIWGGKRRIYATLKFVLYTAVGSLLMLIAMFYVVWSFYQQSGGTLTFSIDQLLQLTTFTFVEELWLFSAFALAFGIKVPIFPFHTWLPDAHVEAPTGGSVILAGVLLKMGLYGFIRFAYPLFPRAAEFFTPLLIGLAVVGIVYGALVAWAQSDMKKLVAYSSVSHLGYCVLGFFAFDIISMTGSLFQMLSHGISTGALFLLVGVLYDRRHTREMAEYGGLAVKIPVFAFLFLVFTLSSIALPLTNGFIGEFLILTGSFMKYPIMTVIATSGVVLGAIYMLTLYMKTMFGEIDLTKNGDLADVSAREFITFMPLLILVFYMGLFPQSMLDTMEPSLKHYQLTIERRAERLKTVEAARRPAELRLPQQPALEIQLPDDGVQTVDRKGSMSAQRTVTVAEM